MTRTSLVALLSLCLAAALVAKEPDSQPQSELETIAVNIMTKAFQAAEYKTVEALFDELSPENKKFLQEMAAMSGVRIFNATDAPLASLEDLTFATQDVDFSLGFPGKMGSHLHNSMPIARYFFGNSDNQIRFMWGVSVPHHSIRMHYPNAGRW